MALYSPRRVTPLAGMLESFLRRSFCSTASDFLDKEIGKSEPESPREGPRKGNQSFAGTYVNLSPFFMGTECPPDRYSIEVVDAETWRVSAGLSQAWHDNTTGSSNRGNIIKSVDEPEGDNEAKWIEWGEPDLDFDEIDNMRVRGNLFYKLDRASKEFEECKFDFHRKSPKRKEDNKEIKEKDEVPIRNFPSKDEKLHKAQKKSATREESPWHWPDEPNELGRVKEEEVKKKLRVPTFNELTGPYHEPFCLDIFISKASVRACIVHRVTSKVVVVAHSISKDMKFDLTSTRNARACEAVGDILAQRALADDIHDVVYTPRRGEVLEGKLGIVVRAIIKNGVRVKLKLKQRKQKGGKCSS